jgi:predicted phosphodiesterase
MIYITGDTHGEFSRLGSRHFKGKKDDYLIICGDFGGVWDDSAEENYWLDWLAKKPFTVLFVTGNHENYDLINKYPIYEWNGGKVQYIRSNVIHLMRGQVFNIEGKTFFTMGGASSHDIEDGILEKDDPELRKKIKALNEKEAFMYRINHISWWKEELPSDVEFVEGLRNLEKHNFSVDYVITHCAPTSIQRKIGEFYKPDRLTNYLEDIKKRCNFKTWFFGHYHDDHIIEDKFVLLYESGVPIEILD